MKKSAPRRPQNFRTPFLGRAPSEGGRAGGIQAGRDVSEALPRSDTSRPWVGGAKAHPRRVGRSSHAPDTNQMTGPVMDRETRALCASGTRRRDAGTYDGSAQWAVSLPGWFLESGGFSSYCLWIGRFWFSSRDRGGFTRLLGGFCLIEIRISFIASILTVEFYYKSFTTHT